MGESCPEAEGSWGTVGEKWRARLRENQEQTLGRAPGGEAKWADERRMGW